ncbi:hypothetical protein DL98DRAFT_166684 [Cadophora sp. DSE1049]|nr:hypothetical protein DL98DRAFT_166684 [Cadophora sp. DSE1049]
MEKITLVSSGPQLYSSTVYFDDLSQAMKLIVSNTAQEQDYTGTLVAVSTNMRPPVSTSRTSIAGPFPRPPIMPPELWKEVFLDLATPDLQAVRLVCRGLILIASDILLRTFIFRPHQRSVSLFNLVAKQGDLLACIKKLRFATGTVGIRSLSANLGPKYQSEYNNLLGGYDVMSVTGKVLLAAKRQDLDAAIKEYVEWNVKWHKGESKLYQSQAALRKMLLKVPKLLDTIEICQKVGWSTHKHSLHF